MEEEEEGAKRGWAGGWLGCPQQPCEVGQGRPLSSFPVPLGTVIRGGMCDWGVVVGLPSKTSNFLELINGQG